MDKVWGPNLTPADRAMRQFPKSETLEVRADTFPWRALQEATGGRTKTQHGVNVCRTHQHAAVTSFSSVCYLYFFTIRQFAAQWFSVMHLPLGSWVGRSTNVPFNGSMTDGFLSEGFVYLAPG